MRRTFSSPSSLVPLNRWDVLVLLLACSTLGGLAWAATKMSAPYQLGQALAIDLSPYALPAYALRTLLRLFLAMLGSITLALTLGTLAAKNKRLESLFLSSIDVLQSLPILGIQSVTIVGFIQLFPGSLLGPECAAIFAILTSQIWNMALSFYQSLKTLPTSWREAAALFQLSPWQTFWKVEVPFATPGLIWNAMVSMSSAWFFVVAAEAISVNEQQIYLPGIGSYIGKAIEVQRLDAIGYATSTMALVILLYDQLCFRPLLKWSEQFLLNDESARHSQTSSWLYDWLAKTHWIKSGGHRFWSLLLEYAVHRPSLWCGRLLSTLPRQPAARLSLMGAVSWGTLQGTLIIGTIWGIWSFYQHFQNHLDWGQELRTVFWLGGITCLKILILVALSSVVWVPIGVWIGLRPRLAQFILPIAQFLAAFPANLIYPVVVIAILKWNLSINISTAFLMILGTQWYILFNVVAGTLNIPASIRLSIEMLQVKRWLWWKRMALPAIFPFYTTGAMAAAGGCWNTCIVSDVVQWGDTRLTAQGLGSYIVDSTQAGDFPRIALGLLVMSLYVMLINRLLWKRFYRLSQTHYTFIL